MLARDSCVGYNENDFNYFQGGAVYEAGKKDRGAARGDDVRRPQCRCDGRGDFARSGDGGRRAQRDDGGRVCVDGGHGRYLG